MRGLKQAGFRITRTVRGRFPMRFLDGSAFLKHSFIQIGFLEDWRSVVDAEDEQVVFTALEEKLNAVARRRGELRLTIPMLYLEAQRRV